MIKCTKFKSFEKGSLRGFADFHSDKWGGVMRGFKLFMKDGKRWISFPCNESEKDGEKIYIPIFSFDKKEHLEAFGQEAIKAIDKYCMEESVNSQVEKIEESMEEILGF